VWGWPVTLVALGPLGLFLLPEQPLVYAVEVVPEGAGAGVIALVGPGWALMGHRLWSRPSAAEAQPMTYRLRGDAEPVGQYVRCGREFADTP